MIKGMVKVRDNPSSHCLTQQKAALVYGVASILRLSEDFTTSEIMW